MVFLYDTYFMYNKEAVKRSEIYAPSWLLYEYNK